MINLCDTLKYYKDSSLAEEADRTPRPNEDIEIIGTIPNDETINMQDLSNCGLSGVGSLTMTFSSGVNTLTINTSDATKSGIDPSNPRAPTGEALLAIRRTNPLRADHGWYSIDTSGYRIGAIVTNSKVSLSNIGLNNDNISCNSFSLVGGIYANGIINTNTAVLNNTKFYGTSLECVKISGLSNTKIDSISSRSEIFDFKNSSIADSKIEANAILSNGSKFIDCNMTYGACSLDNCVLQGSLDQNGAIPPPSALSISGTKLNNCKIGSGTLSTASINTELLEIDNCTINGNIKTNIIYGDTNKIDRNGTVDATYLKDGSTWENSGIFQIGRTNPLFSPIIKNNSGSLLWRDYVKCQLVQSTGGRTEILNSGISNGGSNIVSGIIAGNIFIGSGGFSNNGIINTNICIFKNGSNQNSGIIKDVEGYTFTNAGYIEKGLFISSKAINNGYVDAGIFRSGATNNGTGNNLSFYSETTNAGSGNNVSLFGNATSNGHINYGKLYDVSENQGTFFQLNIYNTGTNIGAGNLINVYNSGSNNSANVATGNFYNTSSCKSIGVSNGTGIYNFYDFSRIARDTNGGTKSIFKFYNNTTVNAKLTATTGIFYNNSVIATNGEGKFASGYFYDNFINSGQMDGVLYFNGKSLNNGKINSSSYIEFRESSSNDANGSLEASTSAFFHGSSYNLGSLKQSSFALFDGAGTYNNGNLTCGTLIFDNGAINYASLNQGDRLIFNNGSVNESFSISVVPAILFTNNSTHSSGIIENAPSVVFASGSKSSNSSSHSITVTKDSAADIISDLESFVSDGSIGENIKIEILKNIASLQFLDGINNAIISNCPSIIFSGSQAFNNVNYGWDISSYDGNVTIPRVGQLYGIIGGADLQFIDNATNNSYIDATSITFSNRSNSQGKISKNCTTLNFDTNSSNSADLNELSSTTITFSNGSSNNGSIIATGDASLTISFSNASNNGTIIAREGTTITFTNSGINNGIIISSGTIDFSTSSSNYGTVCGQYSYDELSNDYGSSSESC
jgi:hypothetical protein